MNDVDQQFSNEELIRYSRHFVLPNFGSEGQRKLKNSTVFVIGAGGLGCPVLLYLAAAGVGSITIIDDDMVSLSNLQRQILFTTDDLNLSKAETASKKLSVFKALLKLAICLRISSKTRVTGGLTLTK